MSLVAAFNRFKSPSSKPAVGDGVADTDGADAAGDVPRRVRMRAWWEGWSIERALAEDKPGEGLPAKGAAPHLVEVGAIPEQEEVVPGGVWSHARIAVSEMLFGDGEVVPGGYPRTLDMIGGFGLAQEVNVLNIGAGLGGAARAIAAEYAAWVEAFEPDPALAASAAGRRGYPQASASSGQASQKPLKIKMTLADKATIAHVDLETLELKSNVYDCAFSRETMFRVKNKARLMETIFNGLKPSCPFLFTDYFLAEGAGDRPEIKRWLAREYGDVHLWSVAQAEKLLVEVGYDLRISDDITGLHKADVLSGFSNMILNCEEKGVAGNITQALLDTAGLWSARVEAFEAGVIEVHKIVVLKPSAA